MSGQPGGGKGSWAGKGQAERIGKWSEKGREGGGWAGMGSGQAKERNSDSRTKADVMKLTDSLPSEHQQPSP